jgi:hypothetical protein
MSDLAGSVNANLVVTVAAAQGAGQEPPPVEPPLPPPDPEVKDTTAPGLVLRAASPQRARQGHVRLAASCSEPCRLVATGRIRILGRSQAIRLVPVRATLQRAGTRALRLQLTATGQRRLQAALRRGLRAQAQLSVRASNASGNARTKTKVVRVR